MLPTKSDASAKLLAHYLRFSVWLCHISAFQIFLAISRVGLNRIMQISHTTILLWPMHTYECLQEVVIVLSSIRIVIYIVSIIYFKEFFRNIILYTFVSKYWQGNPAYSVKFANPLEFKLNAWILLQCWTH